jgi:hypothetical protein
VLRHYHEPPTTLLQYLVQYREAAQATLHSGVTGGPAGNWTQMNALDDRFSSGMIFSTVQNRVGALRQAKCALEATPASLSKLIIYLLGMTANGRKASVTSSRA